MTGAGESNGAERRLVRLSPSLWWFRDTCNVYLWAAGDRGLLIDFGSGAILDELDETGVRMSISAASRVGRSPRPYWR